MDGVDCARDPGLRHDGEPLSLRLGQYGVGRDDDQRGTLADAPLGAGAERFPGHSSRKAMAAELAVLLKRPSPEIWPAADHD